MNAWTSALTSVGWFDKPDQEQPAFDPGENGTCPLCHNKIGSEPRLCRSLMVSSSRSYFFSYHARCRDDAKLEQIENTVVSELLDMDQPA